MKLKKLVLLFIFSLILSQDRSTIFTTYTGDDPDPTVGGYSIKYTDTEIYGAANKFFVSNGRRPKRSLNSCFIFKTSLIVLTREK